MEHVNPEWNIGPRQCWLRMVLGLMMILIGLFADPIGMLLYELGALFFITGAVGFCPFRDMLNTKWD